MKILVINWQDIKNPLGGGAEVHMHEIFRLIAAWGHDVTIFCCRPDGFPAGEVIDGIKIIRKGSRNLFNFLVPFVYLTEFRHEGYDIIVDDINKIPFYTPCYIHKPLLGLSHHFFGKSIFREANLISALYVYISEWLVNFVYKRTPFAVVSKSTLDEFLERGFRKENFTIVQNAITQSEFPMKVLEKEAAPTVSYFGRLKKYKSVDHLFEAFAIVNKSIPESKLWIIGKGDFRPYLEQLAKKLDIAKKTVFWGFVDEREKQRLLARSWCVVNTSMKEGWGITNIEANACGTPVISANVPGLRDSVNEGTSGLLYEYNNIPQLAQLISDVFTDGNLRDKLNRGAVDWASSFSWEDSARTMLDLCQKVIERKKR